jgi:hypothetical protein
MTERRSFYRKVGYLVAIAVLCFPLYWLGHPASLDSNGERVDGGVLSKERDQHQLSQATLGKIDPTSEAMRLGTLGLRTVAVQILWDSAHHYQKTEDWAKLSAVLEQIIRLQPNFYSVWDFQSHNLSYNISVEFDDYRDRFYWVLKGIEFLKDGAKYNSTDPRFLARIGWVYGNKIGRADEHVQYRKLFAKQQAEKGEETDNWLVANQWYKTAQQLVDSGQRLRVYMRGESVDRKEKQGSKGPSPLLFHSEPAMTRINYADMLVEEGTFGESAKRAWETASAEWQLFANRDLPTPYGYSVRLNQMEQYKGKIKECEERVETLMPGEREKIYEARLAKLTPEERKAFDMPAKDRGPEDVTLAGIAEYKARPTWDDVVLRAPDDVRPEVRKQAEEIASLAQMTSTIDTFRGIVNYDYWWARCQAEPTEACLLAREYLFEANKERSGGDLFKAREMYEKSFDQWRIVMDAFPILRDNNIMADELVDDIEKYKKVLGQLGEKFPEPFVLQDMIDLSDGKRVIDRDLSNLAPAFDPLPNSRKSVREADAERAGGDMAPPKKPADEKKTEPDGKKLDGDAKKTEPDNKKSEADNKKSGSTDKP